MAARNYETRYCAIFGDIIKSRDISNRNEIQKQLISYLKNINVRFSEHIIAKFRFSAGDEVRGLLKNEYESYSIIKSLQSSIYPHKMRFGIGIGELSTELATDISLLDGEVFHRAISAITFLKGKKRSHGRTIYFNTGSDLRDRALNAVVFLLESITTSWTQSEQDKVRLLSSGITFSEVGEKLGISAQAVQKSIAQARYYAVLEGETYLNELLRLHHPSSTQHNNNP